MRRIQCVLLAAVVAIGFASIASAADMPAKAPVYRAPVAVAPVWNWSGIYIGGHAGGAWANTAFNSNSFSGCAVFTTQCDPVNSKASGGIGGGQIGVRWQSGTWVYGLESTFAAASLKGTGCSGNLGCATAGGGVDYPTKLNSLFTVTGQLGHAWDRSLLYVKGGYAGARIELNRVAPPTGGGGSEWANGWTVGAGYEYLLTQNFSLGIEYDYSGLTGKNNLSCPAGTVFAGCAPPLTFSDIKIGVHQVVARANFKFDWPR